MILILAGRYRPGEILTGPEKSAKRLFEEQLRSGGDAAFVEYIGRGEAAGPGKKLFGQSRVDAGGASIERKGVFPIIRLARGKSPGIIHVLLFDRAAMLYALCRRREGFRLIYTVHGVVRHEETAIPRRMSRALRGKDRLAERMLFRRADRLVFVSERARETALRYYPVDPARSAVIPNGVDAVFARIARHPREQGAPLRIVLHGSPGRPETRFDILLASMAGVPGPIEIFLLHDDAPSSPRRLPEHVRLTELRRMPAGELARFYADKDVICSLKSYDTFSIATAEGMAAGLIPIVTEQTGFARFIEPGRSGFTMRVPDAEELAEALRAVQSNPADAAAISGCARRTAMQFTWEKAAAAYREIYRQCMK